MLNVKRKENLKKPKILPLTETQYDTKSTLKNNMTQKY